MIAGDANNYSSANLLPAGTALTIDPGAMLDLNGTNQQIGSLAGAGGDILLANSTLTAGNSSNTTFAGTFDGNGALTKIGTGTLTLSGANTYSGVTTISNGMLQAGAADAFSPNSTYVINAPGQLDQNGFGELTPSAPKNFVGTNATATEIDFTWTGSANATSYQVQYQAAGQSTWTSFGTPTTGTSVNVTGLVANTQYAFQVVATDAFGDVVDSSTTICSTTSSGTQDTPPTILYPPYTYDAGTGKTDEPVTGNSVQFFAPTANGAGPFTYTWSATSVPPGASQPTFSPTSVYNYGPYTNVTFQTAGDYTLQAVVTDAQGLSTASSLTLTVQQSLNTISVTPGTAAVQTGASRRFDVTAQDQFGKPMAAPSNITWTVTSGSGTGSVDSNGIFTAPSQSGSATVRASTGVFGFSATATVTVSAGLYQVTLGATEFNHAGLISGSLSLTHSDWISADSPEDAVKQAVSGIITLGGNNYTFPDQVGSGFAIGALIGGGGPVTDLGYDLGGPLTFNSSTNTYSGAIALAHDAPNEYDLDFFWNVSVAASAGPTLNLLDDANNDSHVNSDDKPLVNTDPGAVILTSDPSQGATANADSAHLAEMDISVTPNTSNGQTPADLDGWTLTLAPVDGDSSTQIYGNPDKSNPFGSSKTWTLSGGQGSATTFTTTVYVSEALSAAYTMQLTLNNPSGGQGASPSATALVTAQTPTLTAKRIDGANPDGSPHINAGTADLKHGDTAYVPVDNEDQHYVENGHTLEANMNQTGTVSNDWSLLPFTVHIPNPAGGTYYLSFPSSVRVFKGSDVSSANSVGGEGANNATNVASLLDQQGNATLYIEGMSRDGSAEIDLDKQGQDGHLDTLKVNVFELDGPENVPNFSKYTYTAKWAVHPPPASGTGWSVQNASVPGQSAMAGYVTKTSGTSQAQIYWLNGPFVALADFEVNTDYTWAYHVNIVKIDIKSASGNAFTPGNPGNPTQGDINNGNTQVTSFDSSTQFGPGIKANANVTMNGPNKSWGVDQITIGFVQHVTALSIRGNYPGGDLESDRGSWFYPKTYPILDILDKEGRFGFPWYSVLHRLVGTSGTIQQDDSPSLIIPTYLSQKNAPAGDTLNIFTFNDAFTLDVAAYVDDFDPTNQIYTRLATKDWSFGGNGTMNAGLGGFHNGFTSIVVANPQNWSDVRDGSTENDFNPRYPRFDKTANPFTRAMGFVDPATAKPSE